MAALLLMVLWGCQDPPPDAQSVPPVPDTGVVHLHTGAPPEPEPHLVGSQLVRDLPAHYQGMPLALDVPRVSVVRSVSWPGGGRELTVRIVDGDGTPVVDPPLTVTSDPPVPLLTQLRPVSLDPGHTAVVLLVGATPGQLAAARALVDARPASEKIAIYLASQPLLQLTGFTTTRSRLHTILDRANDVPAVPAIDLASTLLQVADLVEDVGGDGQRGLAAAVVLSPPVDVSVPTDLPILRLDGAEDPAAVSEWLDTLASAGHHTVAVCGPPEALLATVASGGDDDNTQLPATPADELAMPCDVAAISPHLEPLPDTIDLQFSPDELATYQQRLADGSREAFALSIDAGGGRTPVPATAHLRGNGSFSCARRNFVVQLDDTQDRAWFDQSQTDEFVLLSMCLDEAYVEQHIANQLMVEQGSFATAFRYVELRLDGETQGVYLMLEKTREELVQDQSRVRSVLRRDYGAYDPKWHHLDDLDQAVTAASALTADLEALAGTELQDAVSDDLDLEAYLRWLALNATIENGDYIDEAWFTSAEAVDASGATVEFFVASGWDADDIFSPCHGGGLNAWPDPHELAYCAEDALDFILLDDPETYGRYVDTLEQVLLTELDLDRFTRAAAATAGELIPFLDRPGVPEAMIELGEPTAEGAKAAVQAHLDELTASFAARHPTLLHRISDYRDTNP